ncbi:MAG: hypothetical protein WCS31_02390 [Verrucomicrobiae bacterium]
MNRIPDWLIVLYGVACLWFSGSLCLVGMVLGMGLHIGRLPPKTPESEVAQSQLDLLTNYFFIPDFCSKNFHIIPWQLLFPIAYTLHIVFYAALIFSPAMVVLWSKKHKLLNGAAI